MQDVSNNIKKFTNNADLRKQDFLSEKIIIDCSHFLTNVNNEDIFIEMVFTIYNFLKSTLRDVFVHKEGAVTYFLIP